jgi:hypothetical protein
MVMTPPIIPPTIVPLVEDPALVGSLVTLGTAESDAVSADIVVNPLVVDTSADVEGEFLPSSAIIINISCILL